MTSQTYSSERSDLDEEEGNNNCGLSSTWVNASGNIFLRKLGKNFTQQKKAIHISLSFPSRTIMSIVY